MAIVRKTRHPLPASLAGLLPEYDLRTLNAGTDRDLVLLRVLEGGSERQVTWALRRYKVSIVAEFVTRRGASLGPRSRAFWEAYFGVRAKPGPVWRRKTPWRG